MSNEPIQRKSDKHTQPCAKCGQQMPAARSVCPHCGHMTTWFRVRLVLGCGSLLLGGLTILGWIVSLLMGAPPAQ